MKRLPALLLTAAALLGSTLAGSAVAQDIRTRGASDAPRFFDAQQGRAWDSDRYRGWGSDRGRFDKASLEGRWVADDRSDGYGSTWGDFRGRGRMGAILLPDVIRIDQRPNMVRIADRTNRPLQTILLGDKFDSRYDGGDRPDYLVGRWHGSALVVERSTRRGATITQTFTLENRGRTLVVRTRRDGFGPREMEITTTYQRA
jgi:hypothetical protein